MSSTIKSLASNCFGIKRHSAPPKTPHRLGFDPRDTYTPPAFDAAPEPEPLDTTKWYERAINWWAPRDQLSTLASLRAKDPDNAPLWDQRAQEQQEHFAALSRPEKIRIVVRRLLGSLSLARLTLMRFLIHPATFFSGNNPKLDEEVRQLSRRREPVSFFTRDHVQLDASIIKPGYGPVDERLPMLVLTLPNCGCYEAWLCHAVKVSKQCGVNVLLYNDRGIGKSLGSQYSTQQAVLDCHAALCYAAHHSSNVGVYGVSLGGGASIMALDLALTRGDLGVSDIGLLINTRSFASLSSVAEGFVGRILGSVARGLLTLLGIDNLDAARALRNRQLAQQTVVVTAAHDKLLRGKGRMATAVRDVPGIDFVELPEGDHNTHTWHLADSAENAVIAQWARRMNEMRGTTSHARHPDLDDMVSISLDSA